MTKEGREDKVLKHFDNRTFLVAMRFGETPVLIPNTTVKTTAAESTILVTVWEDRWLPDLWDYSSAG